MHTFEIEIKVLLGDRTSRDIFLEKIRKYSPQLSLKNTEGQKNHYFEGEDIASLLHTFIWYLPGEKKEKLLILVQEWKSFSVRTRGSLHQTLLVVKATLNEETSTNGTQRIEWEADLFPMSLEEIDRLVLKAGYSYQAKWSREREEYVLDNITTLDIDKNAGYGYIAEFERIITDESLAQSTRDDILRVIESVWYHELSQDRLARMFEYYNKNWRDYYGTEKVFVIE